MACSSLLEPSDSNDAWFVGACLIAVIVLGLGSSAEAQTVEPAPPYLSGPVAFPSGSTTAWNVAVASDYVFRGTSQTEGDIAISGGVDLANGSFYAGAWASNVSFPGDSETNAEIDLYGGFRPEFAGWNWDIGAVGYFYPGQPGGADYDYVEAKVAASRAIGPATIGAAVFWSPDSFGATEDDASYVEANATFSLADKWTVSGAVGNQFVSSDLDYTTWNIGAAYRLTDTLTLDVRYHDTDQHDFGDVYGSRGVVSLQAFF